MNSDIGEQYLQYFRAASFHKTASKVLRLSLLVSIHFKRPNASSFQILDNKVVIIDASAQNRLSGKEISKVMLKILNDQ